MSTVLCDCVCHDREPLGTHDAHQCWCARDRDADNAIGRAILREQDAIRLERWSAQ